MFLKNIDHMRNYLKILFIATLLSSQLILSGSTQMLYKFQKVDFAEQLPQVTVTAMIQNRQGFMWFATNGGLVKYDGYRTRVYSYIPGNLDGISSNSINSLYEDEEGFLWIGLVGGGLDRFDPVTERFIHFNARANAEYNFGSNYVWAICGDRNGDLWIGTYLGGFSHVKLDRDTHKKLDAKFTRYYHDPRNPNSLSSDIVIAIHSDQKGHIWLGTENGLNNFDPDTKTFTRFFSDPENSKSLSSNRISCMYEDSSGSIWVGTRDRGLNRFENSGSSLSEVTFTRFSGGPRDPSGLSDDFILCIFEDSRKNIWIGTARGGLNKFDRKNQKFISFKHDPFNKHSLSGNQVLSICEDKIGNLWFGMGQDGVCKLNLNSSNFVNLSLGSREKRDMSNSIFSLYEDKSNCLWVGNDYGYVFKFQLDESERSADYIREPISVESIKISKYSIRAIHEDSRGSLWIGTRGEGLFRIAGGSIKKGYYTNYRYDSSDPSSLGSDHLYDILEDQLGNIWIATGERGISLLTPENREKGVFLRKTNISNDPFSLSHNYVRTLYEDSQGTIWVGTNSGGLNRYDRRNDQFIRYTYSNANPGSISSNCVQAILEDHAGALWVGTADAGFNKFDRKSGSFTRYTRDDGLPDNTIYGLLEDNQNNLWISTNKGLSKFNPLTGFFVNFSQHDGIQDNEFNTAACFKNTSNGQLYFGGINGITTFFPDTLKQNTFVPPIQITSFTVLNKKFEHTLPENNSEVSLSYKDYMFTFEFVALDFTNPLRNKYAYKLEGFDENWIESDWSRRIATFTNIPPGRYVFRVKGSNNHGIWNEEGIAVHIVIKPPFWQTWWFRILVILLIAFAILAVHKKRMQNLNIRLKTENEINRIYAKCGMTSREIEVVNLLKKRKSYKEIEDELFISYHTVKNHIHNIFKKLGVTTRAELLYYFKSVEDEIRRDRK